MNVNEKNNKSLIIMTNTLHLIVPEWHGECTPTIREGLSNKFNNKDTMLGYYLGSHVVNLLVPPNNGPNNCTVEVPISQKFDGETFNIENHIYQRKSIIKNNQNAHPDILVLEDLKDIDRGFS